MINSFIAHTSPGRSRVFALRKEPRDYDRLEAVTTLGGDDLRHTDQLVGSLNNYLADRDDTALQVVLDYLPKAVQMATKQYLKEKCPPQMGAFTSFGPIKIVRHAVYFRRIDDELEDYLEGAYSIGLGIRMSNERRSDGGVDWVVQLRDDEVSVPASAQPRSWELPAEVELLETWTSEEPHPGLGPVRAALGVAASASAEGSWVRVHTLLHSDLDVDYEGNGTSEFVVDVFDASIPKQNPED
ncbi:hypothetical protein DR950_07180 [Kitasatospora xanthocidica]|uniref:Uncharacterized protein n=1 Tax=Kitasatospora xanthocidica TaxID=83382 RepID=A0A372ZQB6_9ACTN|nr:MULTISPECIES: hypothetical protein [Kitasatospora]RGD57600.1 hypothetical protein DR950_07180 [Kitasatospora xanthocidica]